MAANEIPADAKAAARMTSGGETEIERQPADGIDPSAGSFSASIGD
ncbi:hypothetical protein [Rhizobium sp. BR 362]